MSTEKAEADGQREQRRVPHATATYYAVAGEQEPGQQDVDVCMRVGEPVDEVGREGERDHAEKRREQSQPERSQEQERPGGGHQELEERDPFERLPERKDD